MARSRTSETISHTEPLACSPLCFGSECPRLNRSTKIKRGRIQLGSLRLVCSCSEQLQPELFQSGLSRAGVLGLRGGLMRQAAVFLIDGLVGAGLDRSKNTLLPFWLVASKTQSPQLCLQFQNSSAPPATSLPPSKEGNWRENQNHPCQWFFFQGLCQTGTGEEAPVSTP